MTEQSFSEKIRRENKWKAWTAVIAVVVALGFTFAHFAVFLPGGMYDNNFLSRIFVQGLIVILSSGVAWAMRDAQRHDLYIQVREHSLTQLRRFRGEIDDEIERLEAEQADGANITDIKDARKNTR